VALDLPPPPQLACSHLGQSCYHDDHTGDKECCRNESPTCSDYGPSCGVSNSTKIPIASYLTIRNSLPDLYPGRARIVRTFWTHIWRLRLLRTIWSHMCEDAWVVYKKNLLPTDSFSGKMRACFRRTLLCAFC
jgi:hypothetical protein